MRARVAALPGAATPCACAAPATRMPLGLRRYRLGEPRADCVGGRLQRDLSFGQPQQLGRAATVRDRDFAAGALTVGDLIRVAGELKDPAFTGAVGKAAAGCGVLP